MTNKTTKLLIGMLLLGIVMLGFANATAQTCFGKGDTYRYCHETTPKVCTDDSCITCMKSYDAARNCYNSGGWSCMVGCSNSNPAENNTIDLTPPVLKILSPVNSTISKTKKLFLNFSLNEIATVYYKDLNKNTNMWTKVCTNCASGNPSYAKLRSFAEGQNNLMFKAVDLEDNTVYASAKFFIDSTAPRIYTTLPKSNAFADGNFQAQFKELNPKRLTLNINNGTDKINLDLSKCYNGTSGNKICDTNFNLTKYNGKKILYYFEIEDIAGNMYKSKATNVSVDTKAPVLTNPSNFFKINGRYVDFNMSIIEDNLYKVTFMRTNSQTTTQTTLCTKLVNGRCEKHQSFSKGTYTLSIQITDKAGHSIAVPASFTII
jgi:thiol-disulfide isomerase/thioredoxin